MGGSIPVNTRELSHIAAIGSTMVSARLACSRRGRTEKDSVEKSFDSGANSPPSLVWGGGASSWEAPAGEVLVRGTCNADTHLSGNIRFHRKYNEQSLCFDNIRELKRTNPREGFKKNCFIFGTIHKLVDPPPHPIAFGLEKF